MKHLLKFSATSGAKQILKAPTQQEQYTATSEKIAQVRENMTDAERARTTQAQNALDTTIAMSGLAANVSNTVKPGDTLGKIAKRLTGKKINWAQTVRYEVGGETWQTPLAKANLIKIGQVVTLEGDVIVVKDASQPVAAAQVTAVTKDPPATAQPKPDPYAAKVIDARTSDPYAARVK